MDQKIRANGALFTSLLLGFCAIISFILGIGMASSYPDGIWWAGLLLILCGILVGYGSVSSYSSSRKEKKISDEQMSIIRQQRKTLDQGEHKFEVLATWAYSISDWKEFMKWEQKERSSGTTMETAIIVGLGTLAIHFLKKKSREKQESIGNGHRKQLILVPTLLLRPALFVIQC